MFSLLPKLRTILGTSNAINTQQQHLEGGIVFGSSALANYLQQRGAARKGKRIERARLARIAASKRRLAEAQNPKPKKNANRHVKIDKSQFRFQSERQMDLTLPPNPQDDVYFFRDFRKKRFSLDEAIDFHKQAVHPDILNQPDALVTATIELNLKMTLKKKKYIENLKSTVCYPHVFQYQVKPRKIIALCKSEQDQLAAKEAGAFQAGSLDIANLLKTNQLTLRDFDHLVCHTDFLLDFAAVKGMKGSPFFPTKQRGNFGSDIVELVKFFKDGIDYSLRKLDDEPAFGFIDCHFGKLNMTNDQLRENIICLLKSIDRFRPMNLADNKQFFERVIISTPATEETFLIKFWELIEGYQDPDATTEDEEAEVASEAAARSKM